MAATNSVYANDTSITLDWADVSGANKYQLQVSEAPDFSGTLEQDDNTLAVSTKTFVDSGTDDSKRWWRWRYSTDAGSTWSEWSEVGSYWLDTDGSADVTLAAEAWAMFDPDTLTDIFTFPVYPLYSIVRSNIERLRTRNRLGTLLSEYLTTKDIITFSFEDSFIEHEFMRALLRFNIEIKTFFLATYKSNKVDTVPHIWKVQFEQDPELSMIASGRPDLYSGFLVFTEV